MQFCFLLHFQYPVFQLLIITWKSSESFCHMLGFCTKIFKTFQVFSSKGVYSVFVGFAILQMCVCVWSVDTRCVHTQSSLSIITTLNTAVLSSLHSGVGSVVKLTFYLHQTPSWLWQIPGLYHIQGLDCIKLIICGPPNHPPNTSPCLQDPELDHRVFNHSWELCRCLAGVLDQKSHPSCPVHGAQECEGG